MKNNNENLFLKKFLDQKLKDKKYFTTKSPTKWKYQEINTKYGFRYEEDVVNDFDFYKGPSEIISWLNWLIEQPNPTYFKGDYFEKLVDLVTERDMEILSKNNLKFNQTTYREKIAINSVMDYLFQNSYSMPSRFAYKRILDFGAGFGRQANLWTKLHNDIVFVGMDAITKSYCLQNFYYSSLGTQFFEYIDNPKEFSINDEKKGIYHLPSWRYDLLHENYFDLIICTQVLNELDSKTFINVIKIFSKILKPGGALYIRDHDNHLMTDKRDNIKILSNNNFILEFRPYLIDNEDSHGTVRIWRKKDELTEQKNSKFSKRTLLDKIIFTKVGFVLYKIYKFFKK